MLNNKVNDGERKRCYYMVRAMESRKEDFQVFLKNNVVAVGWSEVNFSEYNEVKELREKVRQIYYEGTEKAPQVVSKNLNEIERFKNFAKSDYIVVPYYSNIIIAEAEGIEIYSKSDVEQDLANQHKVSFRHDENQILSIPRNHLSEGLQRRLRVRGTTVANLEEFADEIEALFTSKSYSYSQAMQDFELDELNKFKKTLLEYIQDGKTNLKTGGIGLERLVSELMQCEGYETKILPKSKFSGNADADVSAIKEDFFMSKKIFVQVKHHKGYSGKEGIQQVIDVLKQDVYSDYEGYFITSAMIDDETRNFADNHNIQVMDGHELVELIVTHLDELSDTTKRMLGICTIPRMA